MKTEADITVTQLQTPNCQNHQKPEETRKDSTASLREIVALSTHLTVDFQLPELTKSF